MTTFNQSLHQEIQQHIALGIHDLVGVEVGELHNALFNSDYYIIGYYNAEQWLLKHEIGAFEAIDFVQKYEMDNFGETFTEVNAEKTVNMLVYIVGESELYECLNNLNIDAEEALTPEYVEMIQEYFNE